MLYIFWGGACDVHACIQCKLTVYSVFYCKKCSRPDYCCWKGFPFGSVHASCELIDLLMPG